MNTVVKLPLGKVEYDKLTEMEDMGSVEYCGEKARSRQTKKVVNNKN